MANNTKKTNTKKSKKSSSSGPGCILALILIIGWMILLFLGPVGLPDAIDGMNSSNTIVKGQITSLTQETTSDGTFYVVNITPTGGTAVKAAVSQVVFQALKEGYYAEAEFEYNEGLYQMTVWQTQGGALVARVSNHSQEQDDIETATGFSIAFVVVSVILAIWWVLSRNKAANTKTPAKKPGTKAVSKTPSINGVTQISWRGYTFPVQGGINDDNGWITPPPSAVQFASTWRPGLPSGNAANELPAAGWPQIEPPK